MTLENYRALFVVYFVISIILTVVTVVLFFVFDVRRMISVKTGIAVKKSMKQLADDRKREDGFLPGGRGKEEQSTVKLGSVEETARLGIPVSKGKTRLDKEEFFEITESKTVMQREGIKL